MGGASYIQSSRDTLNGWPNNNATTFAELQDVLTDEFISSQIRGIVILAPFMGAAYTCIGVTSLVAALTCDALLAGVAAVPYWLSDATIRAGRVLQARHEGQRANLATGWRNDTCICQHRYACGAPDACLQGAFAPRVCLQALQVL